MMREFQRKVLGLRTRSKTLVEYESLESELERETKRVMTKWSCSRPLRMMWAWSWWKCGEVLQALRRVGTEGREAVVLPVLVPASMSLGRLLEERKVE